MNAASTTRPNVYGQGLSAALKDVSAYRKPAPATRRPSRLSGRRHHVYVPTAMYDATKSPLMAALPVGLSSTGLRATTQTVAPVAAAPRAASARTACRFGNARR